MLKGSDFQNAKHTLIPYFNQNFFIFIPFTISLTLGVGQIMKFSFSNDLR